MKSLLYVSLLLLVFGLTACEKESYDYSQIDLATPEERFDRMQKPQVLFQFAQRQLTTGEETGWIIDREGWVRTYERMFAPGAAPSANNEVLAELELQYLFGSASEGLFQIEKAKLVDHLYQSIFLNQDQLTAITAQADEQLSQAFFAYTQTTQHEAINNNGGCNNGGGSNSTDYVTITQINRLIVDLSGPQSRQITSVKGTELHQWLVGINTELQANLDQ